MYHQVTFLTMTKQIYMMTPDVVGFLLGMGESE